jgi:hypothetical protein
MSTPLPLTERQRFWLEHLRACGSGSLKVYAEAHGLELGTLYEAKSRLKRMGALDTPATRFARVQREAPNAPPSVCRVHLCNGTVVEVACAPEHWSRLLDSVAALP